MRDLIRVPVRLLALLHGFGITSAIVAGLVLMPMVVAVGYWADIRREAPHGLAIAAGLRGSFDEGMGAPGRARALRPTLF